jgi:hypothetical protein
VSLDVLHRPLALRQRCHPSAQDLEVQFRYRTAPLAKLLAIDRVLEDAGVGVTVADENPTIRRKRNIGGSAERGERGFRQSNVVNASICSPATTNAPRTA